MLEKLNRYLTKFSILLMTAALIAGIVGCDGDGYSRNLEIRDWYDLDAVRNNLSGSYILMNDLDSTTAGYTELASPTANEGFGWQPIGTWGYRFAGSFDGQGYEIRDLFIARPDDDSTADDDCVGLFSFVDGTGVVRNVGVVNADVLGSRRVGALVGQNQGSVVNCYSKGSVGGVGFVGGLVGLNSRPQEAIPAAAIIDDSYSTASVSGEWSIGGLVGSNDDILSRSYSTGDVTGRTLIGGLVGCDSGNVNNSYFTGSVTGDLGVGGLVGACRATVSNSHYDYDEVLINGENIITVGALFHQDFEEWLANNKFLDIDERLSEADGYYVVNNVADFKELLAFGQNDTLKFRLTNDLDLGGDPNFYIPYLAGEFDGNGHRILNLSFNFDFVSQVGLFGYLAPGGKISQVGVENMNITGGRTIGGLVGLNVNGTIDNSYSSGSVTGAFWVGTGGLWVGGLVGYIYHGEVSNSYSTGSVGVGSHVGGLVGANEGGSVSNSFWDTETSGRSTSAGGTGKTTAQMKNIATFSDAGWDIIAVATGTTDDAYTWNIVNGMTYPFLS
jgi:hypothetical protein